MASSEPSIDISLIIPSYNNRDVLASCLDSIFANPPKARFEVIVVDDASADDTSDMVRERFPDVILLRNAKNVNYGRSNNRAFDIARGRHFCLLNNDTISTPRAFDEMIAFLDAHPEAGAVGCRLLNDDGTIQWSVKSFPNPMSALFGARSIVTRLWPNNPFSREHLLHLNRDMSAPFIADYVSSAAVLIPRHVVHKVGYLDERLTYHVDADYCKRIWNEGWLCYYLPSATIIHSNHKGGTLVNRKRRFKAVIEFHLGSYIYYRKHIMRSPWNPMHLAVVMGLGARFMASMAIQSFSELTTGFRNTVKG